MRRGGCGRCSDGTEQAGKIHFADMVPGRGDVGYFSFWRAGGNFGNRSFRNHLRGVSFRATRPLCGSRRSSEEQFDVDGPRRSRPIDLRPPTREEIRIVEGRRAEVSGSGSRVVGRSFPFHRSRFRAGCATRPNTSVGNSLHDRWTCRGRCTINGSPDFVGLLDY